MLEQGEHVALEGLDFGILGRNGLGNRAHAGTHEGRELREIGEADALQAFGKNEEALVGHLDDFVHDGEGPNGVKIGGLRRVDARLALRDNDDGLVVAEGVDQLHGTFPAHGQRQHGMGEEYGVAHGKNRQRALSRLVRTFARNAIKSLMNCIYESLALNF